MTLEDSEKAGLPTSTVEYRQLVKLFCPSERFVNFIQVIEANFVESMTIEMMITYDDGPLIEVVCSSQRKITAFIINVNLCLMILTITLHKL